MIVWPMFTVPEQFVRETIERHGDGGRAWLDRLPDILAACAAQWDLTLGPPFGNLSWHYVAPARRADGSDVVVKACSPTAGECLLETAALRFFDGHGAVRLIESDGEREVMVLERLEPGTLLSTVEDDAEATAIAAGVMEQLWRPLPPDHPFPSVADWGKGFARPRQHFGGTSGPFLAALVEEAETLFADLEASSGAPVLLHGDLHHENILLDARQGRWLAIDPKGVAGEPAYETGALMRNQLPEFGDGAQMSRVLARRVDQLTEQLGLERACLRGWGLAQAVLSAWWRIEDEGYGWERAIACAVALAGLPD